MGYFFIALIAIAVIIFLFGKLFAWIAYCGFGIFVLAYIVAMIVIEAILVHKQNKMSSYTMSKAEEKVYNQLLETEQKEYEDKMVEYNRKTYAYNDAMVKYEADCKAALHENKLQFESELPALEHTLLDAEAKLAEAQKAFDADDTLDWRDKDMATIDYLIEKISRKRANSISEGLNLLDTKKEAEAREKARAKQEAERRKEAEKKRQLDAELARIKADYEWREQKRKEMQESYEKMETQLKLNSIDQSLRELSGRKDD